MNFFTRLLIILTFAYVGSIFHSCEMVETPPQPPYQSNDTAANEEDSSNSNQEDDSTDADGKPETDGFVMLFTNDFHSQIEPTEQGEGGVLRMKALVDSIRTAEPYVLLADAGDMVQGTYYFSLLNGVVEMKMLDMLGYDIRTIGNHEFDKKMTVLGDMFAMSKVPVVASNYDFTATQLGQYVVPSKILNAGKFKVGFIGLNVRLHNLVDPTACEGVVWQDAINVADRYAGELRQMGADIVIALSHLGYEPDDNSNYYDRGIAMGTRHIDMIIGGHSHTTLRKPDYITNLDGRTVPVVQTGDQGRFLGYAKIGLNDDKAPSIEYRLIPVNSRLDNRTDPEFNDIIEAYKAEVDQKMNVKLGYSKYNIYRYSYNSNPQSYLGNLTVDGMIWMAKEYHGVTADVSISNTGGIRENIYKGDVTLGDVYAVYPFDNVLSIIDLKGSDLKTLFRSAASGGLPLGGNFQMTVKATKTNEGYSHEFKSVTVNGKQIVNNQTYTVVTTDYLTTLGRYGLSNGTNLRKGTEFLRDLYGEYFKYVASQNNGYIDGTIDNRIIVE